MRPIDILRAKNTQISVHNDKMDSKMSKFTGQFTIGQKKKQHKTIWIAPNHQTHEETHARTKLKSNNFQIATEKSVLNV